MGGRPPSPSVALARRLLDHESSSRTPDVLAAAGERVCQRLEKRLSPLIGADGFRVLLANALDLTRTEHPFLQAVAAAGGTAAGLGGLTEAVRGRTGEQVLAALAALVARFIDLLASFLGESLAIRLVHRAWPEIAWDDEAAGKRGAGH